MTSTSSPARAAGLLAMLAIASALLSNYAPMDPWEVLRIRPPPDIPLLPGIYFGLVLCLGIFLIETRNPLRLALVLVATVVAWVAAFWTGFEVYGRLERNFPGFDDAGERQPLLAIAGVVAGLVGSAITVAGIATVSRDGRSVAICLPTIAIGGAAGVLLAFTSELNNMLPLFLVWQPAVAAAIAFGLARTAPVVTARSPMQA